jgi:hypothetical protein
LLRWCREGTHTCLDSEVPSGATKGVAVEDNELRALLDEKFSEVDRRFEQMDTKFERKFGQMDTKFEQMDTKFDNYRIEIGARLDDMHGDIKKIAESVCLVDEKLEDFRAETKANFKTVYEVIGASNAQLISRIRKLEKKAS